MLVGVVFACVVWDVLVCVMVFNSLVLHLVCVMLRGVVLKDVCLCLLLGLFACVLCVSQVSRFLRGGVCFVVSFRWCFCVCCVLCLFVLFVFVFVILRVCWWLCACCLLFVLCVLMCLFWLVWFVFLVKWCLLFM